MAAYKPVPLDAIRQKIAEGVSRYALRKEFGLSYNTLNRIFEGKEIRRVRVYDVHREMEGVCNCCGVAPIAPGFRYLCRRCFASNSETGDPLGNVANYEAVHHREDLKRADTRL
jgi:hypothetical protein